MRHPVAIRVVGWLGNDAWEIYGGRIYKKMVESYMSDLEDTLSLILSNIISEGC